MMVPGYGGWRGGRRLAERTMCGLGGQDDPLLDSESIYLSRYRCYLHVNPTLPTNQVAGDVAAVLPSQVVELFPFKPWHRRA